MGEPVKAAATMRATVARGRTVYVPTGQRRVVGTTPEGKPVEVGEIKEHGPGAEVELSAKEVRRLRELGYLVDPGAATAPPSGPNVTEKAA